jgi:translocation and assembly module TamB
LTDSLRTTWDLDLAVVGRGPRASISGVARLTRGSYTGTVSLLSLLLRRNTGPPAASNAGLPLHVLLQLENDLVVRTDLARFRARGSLNLEGTTANPILFGTLQGQDGQLVFRKHRFTLVSASARFNDPRRIDPELDILATAQIRDYEVTLNLSGKGDDLSVRFSSTPPLPQEDLLTLVAFGVTRDQLGRAGPGLLLGEAAKLLTQEVLGLEPSGIGLDVLEVETGERGERSLRVGTQLTQQTRAIFSQPLGASGEHKIRIEYQVVGPLLLAGEQNFQGGYGGDLILRLRFR